MLKIVNIKNININMIKTACKSLLSIAILSFAFANNAFAEMEDVRSLADVANTLINGTDFVTRLMLLASMIMGAGFIIFALSSYRQHRMTPKLVPLDRPVLYFVLGVSLCCLPFLGDIFGARTFSTLDLKGKSSNIFSSKQKASRSAASGSGTGSAGSVGSVWQDIDAPIETLDVADGHR